ncbi:SH3 domain-containing protein [Rhizobium daejeonense]|uniref:SH3 domain-containing protein n=1 Tax=Rhizobium daejeonense TaxID=240521 RepID=A0A6M1S860_9HYPH|nr:SH3 domain-containing protein [Rhizobium daejeonense]NGO65567.1 SH3 domain-containing protein [Rhizobium daejeonense]
MKKLSILATGLLAAIVIPAVAEAAPAYSTANVNMRSGPSTRYPAVIVIPYGARVEIQGCMQSANWCDVSFAGYRGWVSGTYLQALYSQRRVYVGPEYYRPLGIPSVTFSIDNYWDRHYRNRDFYRDRDRWRGDDYYRPRPPQYGDDWNRPRPPRYDPGYDNDGWDRPPPRRDNDDRRRPPPPPRVDKGDPANRLPPNFRPHVGEEPGRKPQGEVRRPPREPQGGNGQRGGLRPVCIPGSPGCDREGM